jgi:hypothetical protein
VTGVSLTIAAADRVPYASGKTVTLAFTIATELSSEHQITLSYPADFISSSAPMPHVKDSMGLSNLTAQFIQQQSITMRVMGKLAAGSYEFILSGLKFGAATDGNATGIIVSSSKDFSSTGAPSGSLVKGGICVFVGPQDGPCSIQSDYLIKVLSPLFCPSGLTWAPLGIHGNCPIDFPMLPAHQCKSGYAPSFCSVSSVKVSQTPGLCNYGFYPGFLGFDSSGCPVAPTF